MPTREYTWEDFDQLVEAAEAVTVTISALELDQLIAEAKAFDDYTSGWGWADSSFPPLRYRINRANNFYGDPRDEDELDHGLCDELETFIKFYKEKADDDA
jgi:hypothetical protein